MSSAAGQQLREHGNLAFKVVPAPRARTRQRGSGHVSRRASTDAFARRQEGRYEEALQLYERALKELPNDAGLLCNCAATHLRTGDHQKVRGALQRSFPCSRAPLCAL